MLSTSDLQPGTASAAAAAASPTKATKSSAEDAKIEKSAKDFEAILLSNWLQQAEESFAKVPGGDEDEEDGATAQFTQMAMQSLGTSFAGTGGIGIARMISAQLHKTEGVAGAPAADAPALSAAKPGTEFLLPGLNGVEKQPIR